MPPVRKKKKKTKFWLLIGTARLFWRGVSYPPVTLAIILLAGALWIYYSGVFGKTMDGINYVADKSLVFVSEKSGMVLKDILLEGQKNTPKDKIIQAITNQGDGRERVEIGSPILSVSLKEQKQKLEKLTWVKKASVERLYPSTLSISILERKPTALWQNEGKVHLIGDDGQIIDEKSLDKFPGLILMVGKNVPYYAEGILGILETQPTIKKRVSSVIMVGERRWNVRLYNDIEIKFPEEEPEKALEYLANLQSETKILDTDVKSIDLRVPDKMYVR